MITGGLWAVMTICYGAAGDAGSCRTHYAGPYTTIDCAMVVTELKAVLGTDRGTCMTAPPPNATPLPAPSPGLVHASQPIPPPTPQQRRARTCGPRSEMVAYLGFKYGERAAWTGLAKDGTLIELWKSEGTWTLFRDVPTKDGMIGCVITVGEQYWQPVVGSPINDAPR